MVKYNKIKQLSVFIENRVGVVNEVVTILSSANVNLRAFSLADGMEFGILRMIVPDIDYTQKVLEEAGYKASQTEVFCVEVPNVAGGILDTLQTLTQKEIFIQYMYSFSDKELASIIIRPNDIDLCAQVLSSK